MKKILMVYNPVSGKNSKRISTGEIVGAFNKNGFEVTEKTTTCSGDATRLVEKHLEGHEAVICCGGDGTFSETVNGMMATGENKPIMYLPMGSTNDFAATVGVPRDIETQIDLYNKDHINDYDIGTFNDKYFSYIASFGFASESAYVTPQWFKNLLGHTAYVCQVVFVDLIRNLKKLQKYKMKIEYDGGVLEDEFYFGAISNTNRVGGFFGYDKWGIKLNDGELECLFVRGVKTALDFFDLAAKIRSQDYDGKNIVVFKTKSLKITAENEVAWTFDGEFGGNHKNAEVAVLPSAINIVSPPSKFFITDKDPYEGGKKTKKENQLKKLSELKNKKQ